MRGMSIVAILIPNFGLKTEIFSNKIEGKHKQTADYVYIYTLDLEKY